MQVDGKRGLDAAEDERWRALRGPDAFNIQWPRSAWLNFPEQFRDPLVYLLLIAAGVLVIGDILLQAEGDRVGADARLIDIQVGATALTGPDIDRLDDAALGEAARSASVFARVAPAHKRRILDALQAQGHVVVMTGEGVNDAPAPSRPTSAWPCGSRERR